MDPSILLALNWNSLGELTAEDLEYVLKSMTQAMDSGKEELYSLCSNMNSRS